MARTPTLKTADKDIVSSQKMERKTNHQADVSSGFMEQRLSDLDANRLASSGKTMMGRNGGQTYSLGQGLILDQGFASGSVGAKLASFPS
jgi:hypothetical protein